MNLYHQPGGHPKGDEVESSGEFIAFTERLRAGFSLPKIGDAPLQANPASPHAKVKRKGRR